MVITALGDCPIDGPAVEFRHVDCDACQEENFAAREQDDPNYDGADYDGLLHCPHYECEHCGYRIGD